MSFIVKLLTGTTAIAIAIIAVIWISRSLPASDTMAVSEEKNVIERSAETSGKEETTKTFLDTRSIAHATSTSSQAKTFEQIQLDAERGSAVAQRQLSEIYGICAPYSLNPTTQLRTLDHLAGLAPESKASIDEVKRRMVERCDRVDGGQPIPLEAVGLWAEQAARSGDLASVIRLRAMNLEPLSGDEVTRLADDTLASRDPQAMMEMFNLMSRPINGEMPDRYRNIAGSPLAGAAWGIAACRAGATCSNGSMIMDSVCISTGRCNYLSFEAFVLGEMVPPGQRQRVNTMVSNILTRGSP